jgi:bis(5'-nucleosyl)-tetraphosphatase (symmetrical)
MRRIFVGDIHGCREPLERLIGELRFEVGHDELYPVGDLVAKGPDSLGVLSLLADLHANPVIGNHDLAWLRADRIESKSLARWLRQSPVVREFEDLIVVHAGIHPQWSDRRLAQLAASDIAFATNVRYCDEHGVRPHSDWPVPDPPFLPWDKFYRLRRRVVFGHWARRGFDRSDRVIALDSGCVYGGALTAWIAEEDRVVQVPAMAPPRS